MSCFRAVKATSYTNHHKLVTSRGLIMADLDLNTMSLNELRQLLKDVDRAIDQYDSRRKAEARTRVEQIAKDFGFSLGELVQAAQEKSVSIPRYRHPENPELTWSGRGRKPRWIIEALNSGQSLDKFTIRTAPASGRRTRYLRINASTVHDAAHSHRIMRR